VQTGHTYCGTGLKAAWVLADDYGMKDTIAPNSTASAAGRLPCERRRENRIRVHVPVRIIYQGVLSEVSREAICTDISEAGIGFETQAGLYVGEIVDVEFRDQNVAPFCFQVRLLYKMGNHYGSYFVSSGP
jgi:hypothetical protein